MPRMHSCCSGAASRRFCGAAPSATCVLGCDEAAFPAVLEILRDEVVLCVAAARADIGVPPRVDRVLPGVLEVPVPFVEEVGVDARVCFDGVFSVEEARPCAADSGFLGVADICPV